MKWIAKPSAYLMALALMCAFGVTAARAQSDDDEDDSAMREAAVAAARRLSDSDPLVRQRAAEDLARLAAADQRKLVEGYWLQEKNSRVRLALEWALYRMGKTETLFSIVRHLDSSRHPQAYAYLIQLEGPEPLYIFLERVNGKTRVRLLEVLARIGEADTVEHIKPYETSLDPKIADAARFATREIRRRLAAQPDGMQMRPRQVGSASDETSP
ncbi:MAG TPA: hypothetical protein VD966_07305 [Pyrinomonadaceae bacterium]|nr:hypothetical protein [Pyrinomonadaceae bacterium]